MPYGSEHEEIMLGDVTISTGLVQCDFGRQYPGGFKTRIDVQDVLGRLTQDIRSIQAKLRTHRDKQRMQHNLFRFFQAIHERLLSTKFPGRQNDILYHSSYIHQHHNPEEYDRCGLGDQTCDMALGLECEDLACDNAMLIGRSRSSPLPPTQPLIHFGLLGSGNTVMKSGRHHDRIAKADGIIAFEMEGARVGDSLPSMVIKGVCDYADSHETKGWQRYAAAAAAACAKAFLIEWRAEDASGTYDKPMLPIWSVPFGRMDNFVGRAFEIKRLIERIVDKDSGRVLAIVGPKGIGKTQLAVETIYRIIPQCPTYSIFCIRATTPSSFMRDISEIARRFDIPGIEDEKAENQTLLKWYLIDSIQHKWVLVVDDIDRNALWPTVSPRSDYLNTIVGWLPRTRNGSILITTRSSKLASALTATELTELNAFSVDEASTVLKSHARCSKIVVSSRLGSSVNGASPMITRSGKKGTPS